MKSSKTYLLTTAGALLFTARVAYGDMANGSYSFASLSGNPPIWNISGEYTGDFGLPINMDYTVTQNSDGTLTGTGTFNVDAPPTSLSGDITVSGKVLGTSAKAGVILELNLSGGGVIAVGSAGDTNNADVTAKINAKFSVDGSNQVLVCSGGSASLAVDDLDTNKKEHESGKISKTVSLALPTDDNGAWDIGLTLTPNGTKYTGTAGMETTGGDATFTVTGTYSAKTDTSKLTLKGDAGTISMEISTSGSSMTILSMKGKVFGQSLKFANLQ